MSARSFADKLIRDQIDRDYKCPICGTEWNGEIETCPTCQDRNSEANPTTPHTHTERAREILGALDKEHGSETFVSNGYGYYDDALHYITQALKEVEDATIERCKGEVKHYDNVKVCGDECLAQATVSDIWHDIHALKKVNNSHKG